MRGHSRLLWVLLWVAVVGGVALAVTLDVSRLHDEASEQGEVSGLMFQTEAGVYRQHAAEQGALDDPAMAPAAQAEIAGIRRALTGFVRRVEELDPDTDPEHMAEALAAYEQRLGAVMDALDRHGPVRARALDDRDVSPAFDRLVSYVEHQAPHEAEEAAAAQSAAQRRSVLSFLIGLIGVLAPLGAVVVLRRRADRAAVREELLHQSERRFRALVHNASDAIVVVARDGTVTAVHGPAAEVLGRRAEELVGTSVWSLVHSGDQAGARALVAEPARSNGETAEWRVSEGEGSWRHLEVAAADLSDDPAVGGLVLTLRDVSRRKELEDQLRHRAFHDPLTHLPNRALFLDRAEHAVARGRREGGGVAALFVDLDDFKVVNDRLAHAVGDELLVQVARPLRVCVRSADTAARLGGDEFGILVAGALSASEPVQVAERVLSAMREPFVVGADSHVVHASIGVAVSDATDGSADELMRRADLAMYAAKASGKSRYELFDVALERAIDRGAEDRAAGGDGVTFFMRTEELRAEVEALLARSDAPQMVMQPMLDLRTGLAAGYEALSRFPGSDRPPNAWFSQAHRYALGSRLEARALERALAQRGRPRATFLSLNLSPSALVSDEVWSVLPEDLTGVVVEVTENELAFGKEGLEDALVRLRARGARLAVDTPAPATPA
jgi:diguanylate cyclase (GGDEF)-like protein/PAS domain S-box-containing protein